MTQALGIRRRTVDTPPPVLLSGTFNCRCELFIEEGEPTPARPFSTLHTTLRKQAFLEKKTLVVAHPSSMLFFNVISAAPMVVIPSRLLFPDGPQEMPAFFPFCFLYGEH